MCGTATAAGLAYCSRSHSATLCEGEKKQKQSAPEIMAAAEAFKSPTMEQRLVAEAIGTGIIVQLGCGVVSASKYAGANFTVFGIAATWGTAVALAVYVALAASGYATFGSEVAPDILSSYPPASPLVGVARVMIAWVVTCCYPLQASRGPKPTGS